MTAVLLVMLGAAVGAPCRWKLDQFVQSRHDTVLPWGTFTVNILGSFILGLLFALTRHAAPGGLSAHLVTLLGSGFCGGFTTYSTFGFETVGLAEQGSRLAAAGNALGSVVLGVLAASAGWWLGLQL